MPRKPRVHFDGAVYHVITRGNNKETVFAGKKDKRYYLDLLKELSREFFFDLLIYAIMNNHSHLVMQVKNTPLSKIMHRLQQRYAIYYNREYNQSGHVFENRYKAFLCDSDRYLLTLLRYIHLNPVTANITDGLDYPWSSHACYAGKRKDDLVATSLVYSIIQQGANLDPAAEYLRFMKQTTADLPQPDYLSALQDKSVEDVVSKLVDKVTAQFKISPEQLFMGSRSSEAAAARKEVILTLRYKHNWLNSDIASLLKVNRSYIYQIIAAHNRSG